MKRSTLIATLVLLALAVYVYWLEREETPESDTETVFKVDKEDIVRVEITADEKVSIEKQDGSWRIVAPIEAATDSAEVETLLENIATMGLERAIPHDGATNVSEFGLDSPRLEVHFQTADGSTQGLRFGKDTLTPANQYAQRDGESDVLVVASYLSNNLSKSTWDLRDKAIFHVGDEVEAQRITLTRESGRLELTNEDGLWFVATPPRARADRYQVTSLFQRFRRAEMVDLVSEETKELATYGLDPPRFVFDAELEDGSSLVLEVGNADSIDYYARTPSRPSLFLIEGGLVDDLEKEAADLRSKKIFDAPVHRVTRFQIDERVIQRKKLDTGDQWTSNGAELETKAVEDFLYAITGTEADAVLEQAPSFDASTVISISTESTSEEVSFGATGTEHVYARRLGDEVVLELSAASWSEIDALLTLQPREKP